MHTQRGQETQERSHSIQFLTVAVTFFKFSSREGDHNQGSRVLVRWDTPDPFLATLVLRPRKSCQQQGQKNMFPLLPNTGDADLALVFPNYHPSIYRNYLILADSCP